MAKTISIIGAIIGAIGSVMLIISAFPILDTSELGKISAQAPLIFVLIVFLVILPVVLGGTVAIIGLAVTSTKDKKAAIGILTMSIVALIGGFIPLTLYDYPTFFLCGSRLFHTTFNGMWLNYDAIIMIIGTIINTIGVFRHF